MLLTDFPLFHQTAFINGEWISGEQHIRHRVENPFDGSEIGSVPQLTTAEVHAAIAGAEAAQAQWRKQTADTKAKVLRRWYELIEQYHESLATLLTLEQGKPLAEAKGEIHYAAIDGVMVAKFRNAGQTCVCANRIYVHDAVYDQFVAKLVDRVSKLKVGNGLDEGVNIGPLINDAAVAKVTSHIIDAQSKGAKVVFGELPQAGSRLFQPHILTEVTDEMRVASEETFGPLAALFRFSSEQEVIERANATDSGLAAYCYTQSLSRAWRMSEALEAGIVGINEGLISTTLAPFGGIKESGLGREGAKHGLEEYLEVKYTLMGGLA
ncbi:aldehyde dehydrogenase family protein [Vibrio mimicus]|uniref:aldehyde dehydrogenase family protein n=1 Tax=Vibrio mimicus TaxID=674 RepID=UPI0016523C15|nr:aldehyde dehydrogenase family protein [Vibrio mimicus]